jgi:hypothetical protein
VKILILASPRSGSTSLTLLINEHLNKKKFKLFIEPFNIKGYNNHKLNGHDFKNCEPLEKYNDLLVKSIILIGNVEYPVEVFSNEDEYIDWCLNFFDKVIVLDRKNKKEQSESFVINETEQKRTGVGWHIPKTYNIEKMDMHFYNNMFNKLNATTERLVDIANKNNLPYFLYEDLYSNDNQNELEKLFNFIELPPNTDYINEFINNKNRRVRIDLPKIKNLI